MIQKDLFIGDDDFSHVMCDVYNDYLASDKLELFFVKRWAMMRFPERSFKSMELRTQEVVEEAKRWLNQGHCSRLLDATVSNGCFNLVRASDSELPIYRYRCLD